jgi:hypothetical protein
MRAIVVCIIVLLNSITSSIAQEENKLSKKEKKELKRQQMEGQRQAILDLLESRTWVIEAHTVYDRYNQSYQLNPSINFVGVKENEGALQLGFNGLIGWNGVGGVTIDGQVTRYEVKDGQKDNTPSVVLRFQGRGVGFATINVTVNISGQATARVSGDFGERISFSGVIKSLEESIVYKGQSLF